MTVPLTNAEENPHAGKGSSVLLDIGDDVGAIVITMPDGPVQLTVEVAGGQVTEADWPR